MSGRGQQKVIKAGAGQSIIRKARDVKIEEKRMNECSAYREKLSLSFSKTKRKWCRLRGRHACLVALPLFSGSFFYQTEIRPEEMPGSFIKLVCPKHSVSRTLNQIPSPGTFNP